MDQAALSSITYGLYIICSGNKDDQSGYISNTVMQVSADPAKISVACSKNNYTAGLIIRNKAFSVSVLEKDTKPQLIGLFGFKSGRDTDKFATVAHFSGSTGVPVVSENAVAYFECELEDSKDVGTHMLFIGRIIDARVLDSGKELLTYAHYREARKGLVPKNAPTHIVKKN